jgi:hypothetical protein
LDVHDNSVGDDQEQEVEDQRESPEALKLHVGNSFPSSTDPAVQISQEIKERVKEPPPFSLHHTTNLHESAVSITHSHATKRHAHTERKPSQILQI